MSEALICEVTGGHCSNDPQDECESWGCVRHIKVNCSTCGDYGYVMDGGNMYDCPSCNSPDINEGIENG